MVHPSSEGRSCWDVGRVKVLEHRDCERTDNDESYVRKGFKTGGIEPVADVEHFLGRKNNVYFKNVILIYIKNDR